LFDIFLTDEADEQLNRLKIDKGLLKRYKAVKKGNPILIPKSKTSRFDDS